MNKLIIGLWLLVVMPSSFANTNDFLKEASKTKEEILNKVDSTFINEAKYSAWNKTKEHSDFINQLVTSKSKLSSNRGGKPADGAVLFISFSMPDSLIIALSEQADKYGIPLVVRGLVNNSFPQTVAKFAQLDKEAKKEQRMFHGVSIDPVWFEQFGIDAVPALVVTKRPSNCAYQKLCPNQPYDVVYGNASVTDGLNYLAEHGESASDVAIKLLQGDFHG